MSTVEYRFVDCRLDADKRRVEGVLVNYGDTARIAGIFDERVEPGAFQYSDVILNVQHDRAQPVARSGPNLSLQDDGKGLQLIATIANTRAGDDVIELIRAGVIRGLSAEFISRQDEWRNGGELRVIKRADLIGAALVDRPAYPQSTLDLRAAQLTRESRYKNWMA